MRRQILLGTTVGCCLLWGGLLIASEADELRARAKAMRKEASAFAERGDREQAERLEKESLKLLEVAKRRESQEKRGGDAGVEKEVRHLKERLHDLLAQEGKLRETKAPEDELARVRKQIEGTERELRAIHGERAGHDKIPREFQAHAEKLEAAARRIEHFRIAAQHLKMAEAHDLAHQLMEKAAAMEREVHDAKERLADELRKKERGSEHGPEIVRELKEEIERLRAEVRELRERGGNR